MRVNPLGGPCLADDLKALVGLRPAGLMLPKAEGAASVKVLVSSLASHGLAGVPILPIAAETPAAIFSLGSYREVAEHLVGLTWGAEDLRAEIGTIHSRGDDGLFTAPYQVARALTLFGAHTADCPAIETVFPAFHDDAGLNRFAALAARDGFTGMMAIHPRQIAAINRAFTPSDERIDWARRVVAAFAANPGAGALQIEGEMIDAPHRQQAERILRMVS
ncbi:putative citrate lyase beta chain [Caenibius tardaugens NBRC 16725]|uniref:Putative citrate lyase beta chain n=1 Tax=Caenibius tardaugens NBRC 16725 TaxID=1219035 RepID=U3A0H9_9SPHN|nr:putative citrate lyase beta chain [Caenibius tardaugens NBRC 16725]